MFSIVAHPSRSLKTAFTLVELLVVITIIGILIALLLPAVQAAREAARQTQCRNNIKQLGLGWMSHENVHGYFPTGGWGWGWIGDPDRGFSKKQPAGWAYNIQPYIEQQTLHDLGLGNKIAGRTQTIKTVLNAFSCPTRRKPIAFAYVHSCLFFNANQPGVVARSDYCANGGDAYQGSCISTGPGSLPEGDALAESGWRDTYPAGYAATSFGVVWIRSMCKIADITDGTSNTYLLGERYCWSDHYEDGTDGCDDQCRDVGYDYDCVRWTSNDPSGMFKPRQDMPGIDNWYMFGSAHTNGFLMAFCDGSVQMMNYSIDGDTHSRLGNRKDGKPLNGRKY
jgi:prepilin-type N-terminal cleavage/methylation domain-containing protein